MNPYLVAGIAVWVGVLLLMSVSVVCHTWREIYKIRLAMAALEAGTADSIIHYAEGEENDGCANL